MRKAESRQSLISFGEGDVLGDGIEGIGKGDAIEITDRDGKADENGDALDGINLT